MSSANQTPEKFDEFYNKSYLKARKNPKTRLMHFLGCWMVLLTAGFIIGSNQTGFAILLPVFQYGFAMIGFSLYEKSTPEIFESPFYNLGGDWVMFKDILIGKIKIF